MSEITSPPFQIWRAQLGDSEVLFFAGPEEVVYSFFNFFSRFWNSIYLNYTIVLIKGFRLWLFFSLKESCILFQI